MEEITASTERSVGERAEHRKRSPVRIPGYHLADSVAVAVAVHEKGGGAATDEQLAAFLGYRSTNSGAYLSRIGAARLFGVVTRHGTDFVLTPVAHKILMPVYSEQAREGLIEAFFAVPLFKSIYEEHQGRELPPEFGFKNLLRNKYQVPPDRLGHADRVLMQSAEQAGFFATRGTSTHLILPSIGRSAPPTQTPGEGTEEEGIGGDGGSRPPAPPPGPMDAEQVRLEYVRKLISLLGTDSVDHIELMDRIERLINQGKE
jgi:hypothetical protein